MRNNILLFFFLYSTICNAQIFAEIDSYLGDSDWIRTAGSYFKGDINDFVVSTSYSDPDNYTMRITLDKNILLATGKYAKKFVKSLKKEGAQSIESYGTAEIFTDQETFTESFPFVMSCKKKPEIKHNSFKVKVSIAYLYRTKRYYRILYFIGMPEGKRLIGFAFNHWI